MAEPLLLVVVPLPHQFVDALVAEDDFDECRELFAVFDVVERQFQCRQRRLLSRAFGRVVVAARIAARLLAGARHDLVLGAPTQGKLAALVVLEVADGELAEESRLVLVCDLVFPARRRLAVATQKSV